MLKMNVENDFLTDFDLFGKQPEMYYRGKSKLASTLGIVLTIIYIILYITFLIYKLVRMAKRVDVTFYDSYTFNGLPSITLTNNEFYGAFSMGGITDERLYHISVTHVTEYYEDGEKKSKTSNLDIEKCQLEWFGPDYQEIFSHENLEEYYCIKSIKGLALEGYSNLERYAYFNVKFIPCVGHTLDGTNRECYNYSDVMHFFDFNTINFIVQDNDLNPTDYKQPVIRRVKYMNSPVFRSIFQFVYSYFQIVNIETDEDISGLNFFSDNIRKEVYTKYDDSFIIASPPIYGPVEMGGPVVDVYLQLAAKVLTEKRQYVQLIDVLGDVGGLMEILFTVFNIISSFITEVLYDRSLVNDLFAFDIHKKIVIIKSKDQKAKTNDMKKNIQNEIPHTDIKGNIKNLEDNNIQIIPMENKDINNINNKDNNENIIKRSKQNVIHKKHKSNRTLDSKHFKASFNPIKDEKSEQKLVMNDENKLSLEEKEKTSKIENGLNNINNIDEASDNKNLRSLYINNWLICCFWCTSRKKNVNKLLFEEGSKILTQRLDVVNIFNQLYINEMMHKKLGTVPEDIDMSERCKYYLQIINENFIKSLYGSG